MEIWYSDTHGDAQGPWAMLSNHWKGWQTIPEKNAMEAWAY